MVFYFYFSSCTIKTSNGLIGRVGGSEELGTRSQDTEHLFVERLFLLFYRRGVVSTIYPL